MSRATRRTVRRNIPHKYPVTKNKGGLHLSDSRPVRPAASKMIATTVALGMIVLFVLGFALLVIIGHSSGIANASGGGPGVPAGYGSLNHPKGPCGNAGQAACRAPNPDWFAVPSASPGAVAAAIAGSKEYRAMQGRFGYVSMDTPALVHAYGAHTGQDYYDDDHWVVSVRDASGMRNGIFDFVYDQVHARMRFSSYGVLTSEDPHSRQAFPYISQLVAMSQLQRQRGLSVLAGTHPELIFFPIDPNFPYLSSTVHKWSGGGNSAMNPMWHIVGSDRSDYFVGADLSVHTQAELPIAKGQP